MKRTISLLLATLMVVAMVPAFSFIAAADGSEPATSTYQVYSEDFEALSTGAASEDVLSDLGWYIPAYNVDESIAQYSIVQNGENKALRVSTDMLGIGGFEQRESFVTVLSGDLMSVVRNGDFVLSYDLTYREGTTNADGYTAMIYNFNEKGGEFVGNGDAAQYGIVAVRACGTGFNNVYYPISGGSSVATIENGQNIEGDETVRVMSNRYSSAGKYPSLYSRIAATLGDSEYTEDNASTLRGTVRLIDKTMNIRIVYSVEEGVTVYVNNVCVSTPNRGTYTDQHNNNGIWNNFISRTTGSALGLLTKANVVADIDNIQVMAETVGDSGFADELPELVITEVNPTSYNPTGSADHSYAEYIEIYNPTDHPIDLAEYSLLYVDVSTGTAEDLFMGNNMKKYANYTDFSKVLGNSIYSNNTYYLLTSKLRTMKTTQYEFVDAADKSLDNSASYTMKADGSFTRDDAYGTYKKVKYEEHWNARYVQGNADYDRNTLLNPGECALIYTIQDGVANCWEKGVNAGDDNKAISSADCMRKVWKNYGLTEDTKVFAVNNFNLADNPNLANRRYVLAKSHDAAGKSIDYKTVYITDANYDEYIVSWVDWNSGLVNGIKYTGSDPNDANFGKGGALWPDQPERYTGVYVYGVDASEDPRGGTLYGYHNRMENSWRANAGRLTNYQKIIMDVTYNAARKSGKLSDLMITEIVSHTQNLAGQDMNAFSAVELTNTSSESLDLYRYALVATANEKDIGKDSGFQRSTVLKAGNPVEKGVLNGAYYYFIDRSVSNPETCVIEPGETVVLWLITDDTYKSYQYDSEFGTDYFRQYWVNQGNNQLAMRNADGGYATKVIAVDANTSDTSNGDNCTRVFEIDPTYAAVYGVASASTDVKNGTIKNRDVLSIAYFGGSAIYYDLTWSKVEVSIGTFYANILDRTVPVNRSMRYIPGGAGNLACSAMENSMRVLYWNLTTSGRVYFSQNEFDTPCLKVHTSDGTMSPRLGTLDGEETVAMKHRMFYSTTEGNNTTYHYYDALRTSIYTLQGAAISTYGTPTMRFDNAVSNAFYTSLKANYGANVKVGMLIVESAKLGDMDHFTEKDLIDAGISYQNVACRSLYRTNEYTVFGADLMLDAANYGTDYTAIGYITVTLADGSVKTITSGSYTERSLADVADDALNDVSLNATSEYMYITNDNTYSRYDASVQEILRGYAGR